jgi:hypothetical protein
LIGSFDNCWEIMESDPGPRFLRGTFTARAPNEELHERLCAEMRKDPSAHPISPLQTVWAGALEIPRTAIDLPK